MAKTYVLFNLSKPNKKCNNIKFWIAGFPQLQPYVQISNSCLLNIMQPPLISNENNVIIIKMMKKDEEEYEKNNKKELINKK